jgi:EAL domain-containing protein (putative c-di-GMP-specific phosphodiesterase class I)
MGLRVALDDFGNGYSNLSHLRALPIDVLKIDRSFVAELRNSPNDAVIVDSVISLAHNLRMIVVAEGVESTEQLVHLRTAGCDQVQGYLFSRPVPADEARALIERGAIEPL